jgi:hypothetical protein
MRCDFWDAGVWAEAPNLTGQEIPRLQEKAGFCIFEKH